MNIAVNTSAEHSAEGTKGSALNKAFAVMEYVIDSDHAVSLAEISIALGLPRQTVHRVVKSLHQSKLLIRANSQRYQVGPALKDFSQRVLASLNAQAPVRPVLQQLVDETGETCNVGVLDQGEVIYIERIEGTFPLRLQLDVGSRVPFYCTAIGKLLTAHLHKNIRTRLLQVTAMAQFTERTLISETSLEQEFKRIRHQGYAYNNQEYVVGLTAIAVPIRNNAGEVIAGLAVHAPISRMSTAQAIEFVPSLRQRAQQIEEIWQFDTDYFPTQHSTGENVSG